MNDMTGSFDKLADFSLQFVKSRCETHVHELGFGVHLQTTFDTWIDGKLELELFAGIVWVCLQSLENFFLLTLGQDLCGDYCDFFFLVQKLVQFLVPLSDTADEREPFVLSKDFQELDGQWMESSDTLKSFVELCDFLETDSSVLGEQEEGFGVIVETLQIHNVFVNGEKRLLL